MDGTFFPKNDYRLYLCHHGIKGQKWGVKNGPPYPIDDSKLAKNIHNNAKKQEQKITSDVTSAAKMTKSKMHGLEHRLKTKESIQRKINTDSIEKEITKSNAAKGIKDAVRYTTISNNKNFTSSYNTFKKTMESKGYKEIRCKNYFDLYRLGKVKHKSVQSIFETPSGYRFEVQFHTPESQKVKDDKIALYEERRKPNLTKEQQIQLERQMELLAETIPDPKDVYSIKSHG